MGDRLGTPGAVGLIKKTKTKKNKKVDFELKDNLTDSTLLHAGERGDMPHCYAGRI